MPKTGYKFTKQQPGKNTTNMLKKSAASSKAIGSNTSRTTKFHRDQNTINRLKMYQNGKPIRNKEGTIVGGQFMMGDRAGDTKITNSTGRIQPDRRWFGNTRVVSSTELDTFRDEMTNAISDPYAVVLKRKTLPMGLLRDAAEMEKLGGKARKEGLLSNEPFEHTFGGKSRRKKMKLDQMMVGRREMRKSREEARLKKRQKGGEAQPVQTLINGEDDDDEDQDLNSSTAAYASLLSTAQDSSNLYHEINTSEGIVPWGRDSQVPATSGLGVDYRTEVKAEVFQKGQSKRIWGEFYKVLDCSDVVLHVIDARDVPGTRCRMVETHIAQHAKHKHLVFVLNKIDLVPNWVAKRWIGELSAVRPTVAFHAKLNGAFGKGALISLLRQFGKLHSDKKQISVGVVGYPNVGKSSVINTLISKKSCKVAPIPGETKIWQYVALFRNIHLIDCPGVVVDSAGDSEVDSVLKGVVRAEKLETPEDFVEPILQKVRREHVSAQYNIPMEGEDTWKDGLDLMEKLAMKAGRLMKGGEPCLRSSAITMILDYQRGKLPHFVAPPELKEETKDSTTADVEKDETDAAMAAVDDIQNSVNDTNAEAKSDDKSLPAANEESGKKRKISDAETKATKQIKVTTEKAKSTSDAKNDTKTNDADEPEDSDDDEDVDFPPVVLADGNW